MKAGNFSFFDKGDGSMAEAPTQIIVSFKDIPDTAEVRKLAQNFLEAVDALAGAKTALELEIKIVQEKCEESGHDFEPEIRPESYAVNDKKIDLYVGRRCKKCKVFEPRRSGAANKICRCCGEDMELKDVERAGSGEKYTFRCKSCRYEFFVFL